MRREKQRDILRKKKKKDVKNKLMVVNVRGTDKAKMKVGWTREIDERNILNLESNLALLQIIYIFLYTLNNLYIFLYTLKTCTFMY